MTTSDPNQCMQCGMCNTADPILTAIKKESASTRYKAVLAKQGRASSLFYLATDTGMQENACPAGIALGELFRSMREKSIAAGITTEANEKMKLNFINNATPYESMEPEDWHDKPIW